MKKKQPQNPAALHKGEEEEERDEGADEGADAQADDADEGDGEGEGEFQKKAKKSLTAADLEKSLSKLTQFALENDSQSRKAALLEKAQSGEPLSKSEKEELFRVLGGEEVQKSTLGEEVVKSMGENEALQKAVDVSDYLDQQHKELVKSLEALGNHIEKSDARQHGFNLILAKAIADVGSLTKSMSERLGVLESQPARAPKSRGVAPLQKSFVGQAPEGEQLSKSEILDTMEAMLQKGMEFVNGEDVNVAASKYEQFNTMNESMLNAVKDFRKQSAAH